MEKRKKSLLPRAPRDSWVILIMVWLVYAFNTGSREIMNKVLPSMVEYFDMRSSEAGLISTVGTVGGGLLVMFLASFGERKGGLGWHRKWTQLVMAIVYLVLTFLIGLPFMSVGMLFVVQFFRFGFASAGESADASACADWFPDEYQGFILSAHHTGYPWGSAIISLLVAFILSKTGDWRMPFLIIPVMPILFWIIYLCYAKKKRFIQNNEAMERMGLTPHLTVEEVERQRAESGKTTQKAAGGKEKTSVFALFRNKNVLAAFLAYAFIVGAYFGFGYWLTPYLTYQCNMDNSTAAAFSVVFTITAGLGQLFWGTVSDRVGCKRTVIICAVWLLVCFAMLPLIRQGVGVLIAIQLLMGFCMNASFPVLYNLAGASVKKEQLASAIGICNCSMLFGGLFPYIMGLLIQLGGGFQSVVGYNYGLVFMLISLAIAVVVMVLLSHEVSGPRRGKDWALTSYESCGIEKEK